MSPAPGPPRTVCGLPRRDLILLPLISLGTLLVVLGLAEVGCRALWPAYTEGSCLVNDGHVGFKWKPSCDARVKIVESSPAVYHFNECGFRSSRPCGAKPPGTLRIASLGSSSMLGYWVTTEEVLPEVLATDLERECGHAAESQNLGVPGASLQNMADRVDEVVALHPDLVLLGISAQDLVDTLPQEAAQAGSGPTRPNAASFVSRVKEMVKTANLNSRFVAVARHYLYLNRERYIQAMVRRGESVPMEKPLDPLWEQRLDAADSALARMSGQLGKAGIPLVTVYFPELAELQMIKAAAAYPNLDPYNIESRLGQLAAREGVRFVPSLRPFAAAPDPTVFFFAGDGHLSGAGHKKLAEVVLQSLASNGSGAFGSCVPARGAAIVAGGGARP